jgi:hypothetical protein
LASRESPPQTEPSPSGPLVAAGLGVAASILALIAAKAAGPAYLTLDDLSPWIVVFAIAAFGALMATPFAIDRTLDRVRPTEADHWEIALAIWGAICLALTVVAVVLVFGGDFSAAHHLSDAAGVILLTEAGMALCVLLVLLLGG